MNLHHLFADTGDRTVRYALSGAGGGFARTLLAQSLRLPGLAPVVLCDRDVERLRSMLIELGYADGSLRICADADAAAHAAREGHIALVPDGGLLPAVEWDILVEATGSPADGYAMAREALSAGRHVAMVSKEVDSVAGLHLAELAQRHGVVYTTADGDQPANLIALVTWGELLGLDIVAIGKSSEYDLVLDPATGTVTQLDTTVPAPGLADLLTLGDDVAATLAARAETVAALPVGATADYCEMAVVATNTGFRPDTERLHYPVARIAELADIYALSEDGGILRRPGAVDVFSALRLPGEASFAGGVFIVVRTGDPTTWETLRGKGHVLSRDGRYAAIYLPYHLMGVETPVSLFSAVLHNRPSGGTDPRAHAVLAGRARQDLPAGTVLDMGGHHHDVTGVAAVLLRDEDAPADVAPLYLAAHATLAADVPAGELITLAHLADADEELLAAWTSGRSSRPTPATVRASGTVSAS
ncbi:homoserine dehydrogenase [Streptomyces tsukubensis]|uniref:Homoserine dehydrogenase n=1 Tax=Streptomyces tsukubensis TaxID=83656 RepID=A0A1V4A3Y6_9ACTN|nr:homoserine dehydrogenase [Streptomyces tsukubensis]OON74678.1 homoserine dehydrogenase [Streptomyces tsukubensis]QFR93049.1 homoserine dehydrogenase [Streptomyces tsukubensis]